jgi:hypothetical protein
MQGFLIFHLFNGGTRPDSELLLPERLSVGDGENKFVLAVCPA